MAQITIYLPDGLEKRARKAAKREGTSIGRWIALEVKRRLEEVLPQQVIDAAGADPDFPDISKIRGGDGRDSRREPLN